MQKMPAEYMTLVARLPQFAQAMREARRARQASLALSLEWFDDDPFLLYACLWCACSEGMAVTFAPIRP